MRSIKKIALLVCAAAAVIAVAAPAANATKLLQSGGELVAPGALLSMKNNGSWTFQTSWGVQTCPVVTLPGELIQNNGQTVRALGGLGSAGSCTVGGKSFTFEPELRELVLNSPESGTMNVKFKASYPGNVKCVYENTATPVTYNVGGSELILKNASMNASPAACGPFLITGRLVVKDWQGNLLVFN